MLFPVVLFASIALAQQTPPVPSAPPASQVEVEVATLPDASVREPVADTTQVCRTQPVTGSRFGRRVCRSAAQAEEDRANSREMLRQMQGARLPPSG